MAPTVKTTIVLAMHGTPPSDFPRDELAELMAAHGHNGHSAPTVHSDHAETPDRVVAGAGYAEMVREQQLGRQRRARLAAKMRAWPRTPENDPFFAGSHDLARHLALASGCDVVVGFNEFCDPTVPAAIDMAVARGAERVVVITPMMTRGGEHSEADIPGAVRSAQKRFAGVEIVYAWPFQEESVARFLASQVERFSEPHA